jgi:CelD/BcsL family acetyltransferase involved in cellulose biosynthesis
MLTELASRRGWLLLWFLKLDGAPIAMEYNLTHQQRVYALRADFDEAYKSYSPGAYLEYRILEHLFESEYAEYSFGPGVNSYKLHWTEKYSMNVFLQLYGNNLKGRLISGLERQLLPGLRRIRSVLKNKSGPDPSIHQVGAKSYPLPKFFNVLNGSGQVDG